MAGSGLLLLLACLATLWLALRLPHLGVDLEPVASGGLRVVGGMAQTGLQPGQRLLAAEVDGRWMSLSPRLLAPEPDLLGSWAEIDRLRLALDALTDQVRRGGGLRVLVEGGQRLQLAPQSRSLIDLSWGFWQQLGVGILGYLLATAVWVFRADSRAAGLYALTGVGLLLSVLPAAIYSGREWLIDGDWLHHLLLANHAGALLFAVALFGLLWYYPQRLGRAPVPLLVGALMALVWLADGLRLAPDLAWSHYRPILVLFAATCVLAVWQWRASQRDPLARATLKWFLLSVLLGSGLYVGLQMLPPALGRPPPASQSTLFLVFLIMFGGIALGLTRYRLFDLDRWWFGTWVWLIGGLSVVALDLLLVSQLNFSHHEALTLSLIAAGWIYFPLRQWLMRRLLPRHVRDEAGMAGQIAVLMAAEEAELIDEAWIQVLEDSFRPLQVARLAVAEAGLSEDGQYLRLPGLYTGGEGVRLAFPDRGLRLFRRADLELARSLRRLAVAVYNGRQQAERARREERGRIQRDLHDDLGARLLSLAYVEDVAGAQQLARTALRDLREVLSALDEGMRPLDSLLAAWRAEAETRAAEAGLQFAWNQRGGTGGRLVDGRFGANLGRIIREAVSNVVRHAAASRLSVTIELSPQHCRFAIRDDGRPQAAPGSGLGTRIMRRRAEELGGVIYAGPMQGGGYQVNGRLPWTLPGAARGGPQS